MINNLIDNAVSYAETDSDIEIEIDQNSLSVWNKSDPLSAEQQKHLFELSSGSNGHHGFGLYFAKKIADIHDLALKYGYSDDGVCFTVNKL